MQTKEDYQRELYKKQTLKQLVKSDPYRLSFHIMPPTGWLNDPNGLCSFKGVQHIYFQYTPFSPTWGMKLWGHYTTKDWLHYQEEEPFLFSDSPYDCDGVYSGSAFVKDDQIHYFYTGNVKYVDKEYTYINDGREQNTIEVISKDGYTYHEKHLVLSNEDYPSDMSCHVRDPKIFEKDHVYYMVLGARSKNDIGCVIMYQSMDLKNWTYYMRIQSELPFGYMWECPDVFEIDGKLFLICCPQGVPQSGSKYQNVYQFGYFELQINFEEATYTISSFKELDKGFDIYAPQTYQDEQGRRILLAWMGIPDAPYDNNQTVEKGWQHALTLPRELYVKNQILCQKPLVEMEKLRINEMHTTLNNTFVHAVGNLYECKANFTYCETFEMSLRHGVWLQYEQGMITLKLDACGCGRTTRYVHVPTLKSLQIFVDTSSIEIFINDGEEVMTSRYYTLKQTPLTIEGKCSMELSLYELKGFHIQENNA